MSRIAWHRPARVHPPALPDAKTTVAAPPQVQQNQSMSTWMTLLLPLLSSVSIAGYMFTYGKPLMMVLAIVILSLSVGLTFGVRMQMRNAQQRNLAKQRQRYLLHLAEVRRSAREVATLQRIVASWQHPSPERLRAVAVRRRRLWERRPSDADFLQVRVGTGAAPLCTPLLFAARNDPTVEYEPESMRAGERVVELLGRVDGQPALVDLGRSGVVSVLGPAARTKAVTRALLTQLFVLHAPEDVTVAVCTGGDDSAWSWASWLPHTRPGEALPFGLPADPEGRPQQAFVASDYEGLSDVLEAALTRVRKLQEDRARAYTGRDQPARHRLVLVVDSYDPGSAWGRASLARQLIDAAGPATGITVITLVDAEVSEPSRVDVRIRVDKDGRLALEGQDPALRGQVDTGTADEAGVALCEAAARTMAPLVLSEDEQQPVLTRTVPLVELLGLGDLDELDPRELWVAAGEEEVLRVPLGTDAEGTDVVLDLKESAQEGMGPHGLIVGATGSGKSELLRTLVTGLTATHPPELLSLVLVDFKGGATFAGMTELPHVAGLITNLADDLALVDRVLDALSGEQQRRQQMLRDAGNVDSVREYQIRQAAGGEDIHGRPLQPLPYLLVIVDEFGELLSGRPDFINLFVQIGRVGRSLGIHLLLATQRLEEGRLRGLESHLSYRVCLRTFSAAESRTVIGTNDAYTLPPIPGSAYLKVDESVYTRFRVAHVSGQHDVGEGTRAGEDHLALPPVPLRLRRPEDMAAETVTEAASHAAARASARALDRSAPAVTRSLAAASGPTQMHVIVERLKGFGHSAHQVWLPPLPAAYSLDSLIGPVSVQDKRGMQASGWPFSGQLRFPVGVVDIPLRQLQQPLVFDLGQTHPHLALVGAPQSGKSTLLRTAMLSAMLTHTPDELHLSVLDFGGGALHALAQAPHVAGVAGRHEPDRARRIVSEARRLIDEREQLFRDLGIGSIADFRRQRDRQLLPPGTRTADLVLVVDNWGAVRTELEGVDAAILDIAGRGPAAGVHLMIVANRWGDVRMNLRDAISARLELRLNEPAESEVNRRLAKLVPAGIPGRGIAPPGQLHQAALPRLDGRETLEDLADAQQSALDKIITGWTGTSAPRIQVLPERILASELVTPVNGADAAQQAPGAVVAVGERDLKPVRLDLAGGDQHLLVIGDSGSGKSSFLRTWMRGMADRYSPFEVRFLVVDYRRSLTSVVPEEYIGAYATDVRMAGAYAEQLSTVLEGRLPPPQLPSERLRKRDWWEGPDLYLVVDDYDLVTASRQTPLQPLLEYAAHSREVGFHVLAGRRSGGVARALTSEPLFSRVRELGCAGLLLSADPAEGVLLGGRRGQELPPGRAVLMERRGGQQLVQIALGEEE